jgi:hypothetical protein
MDSIKPPAASTTLYTNIMSPVAKPSSFTQSRPPHGGNRSKYHIKSRKSGNGDDHNDKNSTGGGGCAGSSSQTTATTGSDDRTNAP